MKTIRKFCNQCGAKLPKDAAFCPGCGRDVLTEAEENVELKIADNSGEGDKSFTELWAESGPMQKLVALLLLEIVIAAVSTIFGYFDVREYYDLGRCAYLVLEMCFAFMSIWLTMAMFRRKSWARKSYIFMTVLGAALMCFDYRDLASDNLFVNATNIIGTVIGAICVFLLFTKEVRVAFLPDARLKGSRAAVNRHHCLFYWFVFVMIFVGLAVQMLVRYGSEDWIADCKEAAIMGSSSARKDLIEKLKEEYVSEMSEIDQVDEGKLQEKEDEAEKNVDEYIENNKRTQHQNRASEKDIKRVAKPIVIGLLKGGGKLLVLLFAFCGSLLLGKSKKK